MNAIKSHGLFLACHVLYGQKQIYFFNQAEHIFIVGIAHVGNKNIKRCTSLIKLAFLVLQNLISIYLIHMHRCTSRGGARGLQPPQLQN